MMAAGVCQHNRLDKYSVTQIIADVKSSSLSKACVCVKTCISAEPKFGRAAQVMHLLQVYDTAQLRGYIRIVREYLVYSAFSPQ